MLPGSSTDRGRNWWIKFVPGFPRLRRTSFPLLGDQPDEEAQEDEDYESCAMWPDFVQGVSPSTP